MATTRGYWNVLRTTRDLIGMRMGVDVNGCGKEARALANANLAAVAIVIKALTDKGVVTDAELQARANAALGQDGSIWDDEPLQPPPS